MVFKSIFAILFIILAVLQYNLWQGSGNIRDVLHLQQVIATQTEELKRLTQRNRQLSVEVAALKANPNALEERARTELGMIKKGEAFCLVVEQAQTKE